MEWQRQTRKCFEVTGFCVSLDHFSRSIILSRLGVDQSYTRNLPTSDLGGRRKTRRRGEQKKAKILSLSDKRHTTPAFSSFIFHFQTYFRNCSELNQVQKRSILWALSRKVGLIRGPPVSFICMVLLETALSAELLPPSRRRRELNPRQITKHRYGGHALSATIHNQIWN